VEADAAQAARPAVERAKCVDEAANALRERLELEGIRSSYRRNLESMQRVHVSPALADRRVDSVRREDIERLARAMAQRRRAPRERRLGHAAIVRPPWTAVKSGLVSARPATTWG